MELDADTLLEQLGKEELGWQEEFRIEFARICERAEKLWPAFKRPALRFNTQGRAAGWAYYKQNEVRLNHIYCKTQKADMLRDTLPHEIAHHLAFQRYKDHAHGGAWYAMFGALTGRVPTRCHDYEHIAQAKKKVYGA